MKRSVEEIVVASTTANAGSEGTIEIESETDSDGETEALEARGMKNERYKSDGF